MESRCLRGQSSVQISSVGAPDRRSVVMKSAVQKDIPTKARNALQAAANHMPYYIYTQLHAQQTPGWLHRQSTRPMLDLITKSNCLYIKGLEFSSQHSRTLKDATPIQTHWKMSRGRADALENVYKEPYQSRLERKICTTGMPLLDYRL